MYYIVIKIHVVISILFLLTASIVSIRSLVKWQKGYEYSKNDNRLAFGLIILLYISLFLGIILYFVIAPGDKVVGMDLQQAIKKLSVKFWAIEHFVVMSFALILSQIGRIFTNQIQNSKKRHGYAAFYYGLSTFLTIISLVFYLIYK